MTKKLGTDGMTCSDCKLKEKIKKAIIRLMGLRNRQRKIGDKDITFTYAISVLCELYPDTEEVEELYRLYDRSDENG